LNEVTTVALDRFFASPLAMRLALQHGIDLSKLTGTGPRGRIRKADVAERIEDNSAVVLSAPPPVEIRRMSQMRKAIAKQLTLSKTSIPHFYLRCEVRVDALQATRLGLKQSTGTAPSLNSYILRACALALAQSPDVNVQVHGDDIHRFAHADISVATATDRGLLTPVLRAAETKSVAQIATEVQVLATRAREGKLQLSDIEGGSFSVSNLGMFGIDQFDAIINPPQGAILAVGAVRRVPVEASHSLCFATVMSLSLSCDHRAIDGAVGARFIQVLRNLLEQPEKMASGEPTRRHAAT
jgi:pyruvate dehydrogenase E2 component (dihydrolipoamide acetyltransferase)